MRLALLRAGADTEGTAAARRAREAVVVAGCIVLMQGTEADAVIENIVYVRGAFACGAALLVKTPTLDLADENGYSRRRVR